MSKFENTNADSPVYLRNEDATKAANLCARQLVDFLDGLMAAQDDHERAAVIERAREHHANVFDAFIYGVDWGRANPREERTRDGDGGEGNG